MHKAVFIGLLAASLAAPIAANAQSASSAPAAANDQVVNIRPAQWLTVGVGVVVGAAVLDVIMPSNIAFVVGGIAGGYLANAWYNGKEVSVQLNTSPKT